MNIIKKPEKIQCGCKCIDDLLGGGFEGGIVTQLYGASGTGKTNICIQLAIETVKNGRKVILIDTEGFSADRFRQIAGEDAKKIAGDIIIYEPSSLEQQYSAITDIEKIMNEKIGLIILDSAALYYRLGLTVDDSNEENIALRRELVNQIGILHGIARKYGVSVVITNQVYKDVTTGEFCPIGGNALEHLSKTIVLLERTGVSKRRATLRKHRSKSEALNCDFILTDKGVE
ncbi:MAG: DNA repair and recombination protein RadB [Candidatus Methanoperedens sp.]|nr:DNA repair and recombination protein RadB [Candidatus Methanoperedens sp.]MCE8424597.1 DNA repair and recombination protein RadB [Candidatus Methanoperedens sp.]MCE8428677.1 DNA repair and recombination protein RadB [Candidatus Methanoperedens sp.]